MTFELPTQFIFDKICETVGIDASVLDKVKIFSYIEDEFQKVFKQIERSDEVERTEAFLLDLDPFANIIRRFMKKNCRLCAKNDMRIYAKAELKILKSYVHYLGN